MDKAFASDGLYGAMSYWRASAGAKPSFAPRRNQDDLYDVIIVGGGFHGLWAAYHLLNDNAGLSVALVDQHHIGFGATGRNGGFASTKVGLRVEDLERKYGIDAAREVITVMGGKIAELVSTVRAENIECEIDHGGLLLVATNKSQEKRLRREFKAIERIGLNSFSLLTSEEVRKRVNSPTYLLGVHDPDCAILHPLKLARGLAQVCVGLGLDIYENTRVQAIDIQNDVVTLKIPDGCLRARKTVMTLNAWAGQLVPKFKRTVLPVYTYILMTEPITEAQWSEIGWGGREGVEDSRLHLQFYRRTQDGRILWGGSDNKVPFLGRINSARDSDEACFRRLEATFQQTFPMLSGTRFEYRWGGCFAVTPDFNPHYGVADNRRLIYGHGCCGHGVGLSFFGGQIMRDLVLERPTQADNLLFMNNPHGRFPPEPLRSIGGSLTLQESRWYDDAQERGLSPSEEPLLLRLAPKWFG